MDRSSSGALVWDPLAVNNTTRDWSSIECAAHASSLCGEAVDGESKLVNAVEGGYYEPCLSSLAVMLWACEAWRITACKKCVLLLGSGCGCGGIGNTVTISTGANRKWT